MGITLNDIKQSKYLTKEDAGEAGKDLTIQTVVMEQVGEDSQGHPEMKAVIYWMEPQKPMVCNVENFQRISRITGQGDTDFWPNTRICVYNDPFVSFGNRQTGGLRVRPVGGQTVPQSVEQGISQVSQAVRSPTTDMNRQGPVVDTTGFNDDIPGWE